MLWRDATNQNFHRALPRGSERTARGFDVDQHVGEGEGEVGDFSHGSVSLRYQRVRLSDNLKFTSAHTMPTTFSASALG